MLNELTTILKAMPISYFQNNNMIIPLWQMILYILIISFCLLFKKDRLGLSVSFIFCFLWGFIVNRETFLGNINNINRFSLPFILYIISGFIVITLSIISFFRTD